MATGEEVLSTYREKALKLSKVSLVQVRQLMGTQPAGDPRVEYLAGIQCSNNLVNAQLAALLRVLPIDGEKFMAILAEELDKQLLDIEKDLCITGWSPESEPIFDLAAYRKRTEGWPE